MQAIPLPSLLESLDLPLHDPLFQAVQEMCQEENISCDQWVISLSPDDVHMWLVFQPVFIELPYQAWKVHISADSSSGAPVIQRVLPLLLRQKIAFKCVSSLKNLLLLNSGRQGQSQVGKFITIYPKDDQEAVSLAAQLDEMTRGFSGPQIPSDRMLQPGSLIFYRYASYVTTYIQEKSGRQVPGRYTLNGQRVPDLRTHTYQAPEGIVDPFLAAGIAIDLPPKTRILAQRYLVVSAISASINHRVSMAIDLQSQNTCIIKGPGRPWQNTLPPSERQGTKREALALRELADLARIPTFYELIEHEDDIALIMSDIPGQSLAEHIQRENASGPIALQQIIVWARDLAEILQDIHLRGYVHADLKPTNVLIGPEGKLFLIDFELADRAGAPGQAQCGTAGYASSQQFAGEPRSVGDDIYSFGALLYLLITGAEPSQAPDAFALLRRPIEQLRPHVPTALRTIVSRCLQEPPLARYHSMQEVLIALDHLNDAPVETSQSGNHASSVNEFQRRVHAREIAANILHTLCATATQPEDGEGLTWKTSHPIAANQDLRDLNSGLSGTVLALTGLVAELGEQDARNMLLQSALWLCTTRPQSDPPLPGLYIGEAGVGAALLFAGKVLAHQRLIDAATERGKQIAALPHTSPDMMHGTAGRLLFHLLLWEETKQQEQLSAALACGEYLLNSSQAREGNENCWTLPADMNDVSRSAYLGYAHGASGIADALLDLFEVTGDKRFVPIIQGAARWLQRFATPALADRSGLSWPINEDRPRLAYPFWCHGAAGIGRFFLHASHHPWIPGALEIAQGAAQAVIHLSRSAGPTLCHGLAGSIQYLLDMYQESNDPMYLREAQTFGELLTAFAAEKNDLLVFHTDHHNVFSPDYQVGYAGIAISFLRLSQPELLPYQLSRAGFRASQSWRAGEPIFPTTKKEKEAPYGIATPTPTAGNP